MSEVPGLKTHEEELDVADEPETEHKEKGESVPGIVTDTADSELLEENVESGFIWAWVGKASGASDRVENGFFPASEVTCTHQCHLIKPRWIHSPHVSKRLLAHLHVFPDTLSSSQSHAPRSPDVHSQPRTPPSKPSSFPFPHSPTCP